MKIVFNGMLEKITKGCNCKKQGNSGYGFVTQRLFFMPSGAERVFQVGKVEEVNEKDAQCLLSYIDKDVNGVQRQVFTKVDD